MKMIKKLALLLCAVMVLCSFATVAFAADEEATIVIEASKTEVLPGETVDFTVSLVNADKMDGGVWNLEFRLVLPAGLTLVAGSAEVYDDVFAQPYFTGKMKYGSMGLTGAGYTGEKLTLLTFQCTVNADATGEQVVTVTDELCLTDKDGNSNYPAVLPECVLTIACAHVAGEVQIENVVKATCEDAGSHDEVTYCTECGEEMSRVNVVDDAIGHDWKETERVEATCLDGKVVYTCANCGETKEEVLPATGEHTWVETERVEATGCTDGKVVYTCEVCGETKEEVIEAAGEHTWVETNRTEANCCNDGVVLYTCEVCGETKEEVIDAAGEHTLAYYDNEDGKTHTVYCQTGDKVLNDAESHTFVDGVCVCGAVEQQPPMGDNSVVAVAMATLSMLGIALVVSKKKEF